MSGGAQVVPAGCPGMRSRYSAFLYLPIVTLIVYSFNGAGVGGFPPRNLTLDWYRMLFADDAIWTSVGNSLLVAFAAMAISLTFRHSRGPGPGSHPLSRESAVPPPGAFAADPAGNHHRPFAADAVPRRPT